jgi:hypothetical protein
MKKISFIFLVILLLGAGCAQVKEDKTQLYQECINECNKNVKCLRREQGPFVPGGPDKCLEYSSTAQCTNICVSKYK